ncbi:MAG: UTP--glucose-1-phosphate uridylyltransferase [Gammaproteobacteria bacterium]
MIKSAVFPVAGLGTRFLPVTKSVAKELMPILSKPIIQYAVSECLEIGVERLILVTSRLKVPLIDYLEYDRNLERTLEQMGKYEQLEAVRNILPADFPLVSVRQQQPRGLGDAVLCARPVIGDEPFVLILPDDLLVSDSKEATSPLKQMLNLYQRNEQSVVAVEHVSPSDISSYGVVDPLTVPEDPKAPFSVRGLVEKPDPSQAPSQWGIVGRYILSPDIFQHLEQESRFLKGLDNPPELQLTSALDKLAPDVTALPLNCHRYDCGSQSGFLKANLAVAAQDPELKEELRQFVQQHLGLST